MITHEVRAGSTALLGCFESFEQANRVAIEHVKRKPVYLSATVYRIRGDKRLTVVSYYQDCHTSGMPVTRAELGPSDPAQRKALDWETEEPAGSMMPCPFCGSIDVEVGLDDESMRVSVTCMACQCDGPFVISDGAYSEDEDSRKELDAAAIALWNRRVV